MSKQKDIILSELRKLQTHPTADELYPIVKKIMPSISLGTVYRNLNLLAEQGVITKLEHGGSQKRFDANVDSHYHLRCQRCGKVYDLTLEGFLLIEQMMNKIKEHEITGYHLEFFGICKFCKQKEVRDDRAK
jgi:Fur family ferric uptake transcriptional regulator